MIGADRQEHHRPFEDDVAYPHFGAKAIVSAGIAPVAEFEHPWYIFIMDQSELGGRRFGHLVALERRPGGRNTRWLCQCDCGQMSTPKAVNLRKGITKSCGCAFSRLKHGHGKAGKARSPTYNSWQAMIQRCSNPKTTGYKHWGGRGIKVCDRWRSFQNFLDDMGERPAGMSIDRRDNDGSYEPGNCRWATRGEQSANQIRRGRLSAPRRSMPRALGCS